VIIIKGIIMKVRAYVSLLSVIIIALISGYVLWNLTTKNVDLGQLGLTSVFLTSLLSHLTVVARDMFIPLFMPLTSIYNPFLLGFLAGTGGAIGEVTTYVLGYGVAESIERKEKNNEDKIVKWIEKYGLWAVLLVSLTPLPDTPIILLAGSRRLPFWKLLFIEILGKTCLYSLGAIIGGIVFISLESSLGEMITSTVIVIASILFTIGVTWKPSRDMIFEWAEKIISYTR
jgi:membrane protein YqaA with SNARE-associated domain